MRPVVVVPRLVSNTVAGSSKRARVSFDDDDGEIDSPAPKQPKTTELKGTPGGPLYPKPCEACARSGHECREQIPVKKICYRCASLRSKCSLKPGPKYGRGANRGRVVSRDVETDFEVESEDEPSGQLKNVSRRSDRFEENVTREDVKSLIESVDGLAAACKNGFKELVAALKIQSDSQVRLNDKIDDMQIDFRKIVDRLRREDGEAELGDTGLSAKEKFMRRSKFLLETMNRRGLDRVEFRRDTIRKALSEGSDPLMEGIENAEIEERGDKGKGKEEENNSSNSSESENEE